MTDKKFKAIENLIKALTDNDTNRAEQQARASAGQELVVHVETLLLLFYGADGCSCGASKEDHDKERDISMMQWMQVVTNSMMAVTARPVSLDKLTSEDFAQMLMAARTISSLVMALTWIQAFTRDDVILRSLKSNRETSRLIVEEIENMTTKQSNEEIKLARGLRVSLFDSKVMVKNVREKIELANKTSGGMH